MPDKLLGSKIVGGNPADKRSEMDYYPTPPEATIALLNFLEIPSGSHIWEPACGGGHMVRAMESKGYIVTGTDIQTGNDFFNTETPENTDWIITNPPFSLAAEFIEECYKREKPFALLLKSQFWHAKKRYQLFQKHKPDFVLPMTWRPNFMWEKLGNTSPLMDVIWCVWKYPYNAAAPLYEPLLKPEVAG